MPGYIDRCDEAFSLYIRINSADERGFVACCTCGTSGHYREFDCGHGVPRGNMSTRFDVRNAASQCRFCNRRREGEREKFAVYVDNKHGDGTWETLLILSRQVCKRTKAEINEMAEQFRQEVARLKKEKGL